MMRNSIDWFVIDYTSILLGFVVVPLAPTLDADSTLHVCRLVGTKLIFADEMCHEQVI